MERTPSLWKKEDSLQREEKSQFLVDLVIKIHKTKNEAFVRVRWPVATSGYCLWPIKGYKAQRPTNGCVEKNNRMRTREWLMQQKNSKKISAFKVEDLSQCRYKKRYTVVHSLFPRACDRLHFDLNVVGKPSYTYEERFGLAHFLFFPSLILFLHDVNRFNVLFEIYWRIKPIRPVSTYLQCSDTLRE